MSATLTYAVSLCIIGLAALAIGLLLAPFETLGWWAGWYQDRQDHPVLRPLRRTRPLKPSTPRQFLVFLSGVGSISGALTFSDEQRMLERLAERLPDVQLVIDVFPYSVINLPLTTRRPLSKLWNWLDQLRQKQDQIPLAYLINLRNLLQVLVSIDGRYGPLYNIGTAHEIIERLIGSGYRIGSGIPVTLLGYSGGAQIALGAVAALKELIRAPVRVISLAGVFGNDPSLASIDRLYHLYGDYDPVQRLGAICFPGRWRVLRRSFWNVACDTGRVVMLDLGPMHHDRQGGYLDPNMLLPDGRTHLTATIDALETILKQINSEPITRPVQTYPVRRPNRMRR